MAHVNAMRQIGVKNMGNRIEIMEWSNKMDLIAIGNEKGEIIIQRLNWQKICIFQAPGENIKIRALSWQPDEALIAAAYSNGKIALLDIETEDEIYSFDFKTDIKTMNWTKSMLSSESIDTYENKSQTSHENFLSSLPNLGSISSNNHRKTDYNTLRNFSKKTPNFLIVCLVNGKICLSVFGVLPCGIIDITKYLDNPNNYEIYDVQMSLTFDEIFVFVKDDLKLKNLILKNNILSKYTSSLLNLATKHGYILETLNYINDTIQCISEAWETALLEMDNKLTKYVNSQPQGSLSADFLELLMFGYPSESLELFLTRDLTEKGLKKLGNSIELSYTTIQNLVVKSLHTAAINLFFHLNTLKGLSRNMYCYKALITIESVQNAFASAGSFLLKINELQQTIDQSVNDYKIFWCWLSAVIVRLMEETVSDEAASATQEDITYLADFLNTFDDYVIENDDGTLEKRKFNLEHVGQYLENKNLQFPYKYDIHHQWDKLLNSNDCLSNSELIFLHNKKLSLIQQYNLLKNSINDLFLKPSKIIEENFMLKCTILCSNNLNTKNNNIFTSYIIDNKIISDMLVILLNSHEILFIESYSKQQQIQQDLIKTAKLNLSFNSISIKEKFHNFNDIIIKHMQFYNNTILSLLLQANYNNKSTCYFVQLPIDNIREKCSINNKITTEKFLNLDDNCIKLSIFDFIDFNYFKPIESSTSSKIAVSGSRKVAAILSDNCKKIRVFEMEIEDDDDEIEMSSQNLIIDSGGGSGDSKDLMQLQE